MSVQRDGKTRSVIVDRILYDHTTNTIEVSKNGDPIKDEFKIHKLKIETVSPVSIDSDRDSAIYKFRNRVEMTIFESENLKSEKGVPNVVAKVRDV